VLIVACSLALLKKWPECLLAVVLLGIPLAGLSKLLGNVPPRRTSWRIGISAVMLGLIILGVGWFSARVATWILQQQEGFIAIVKLNRGRGDRVRMAFVAIPAVVTAFGLFLNVLALAETCIGRRRFGLLILVAIYAFMIAGAWCALFGLLAYEGAS
jgi:hypothetical protein